MRRFTLSTSDLRQILSKRGAVWGRTEATGSQGPGPCQACRSHNRHISQVLRSHRTPPARSDSVPPFWRILTSHSKHALTLRHGVRQERCRHEGQTRPEPVSIAFSTLEGRRNPARKAMHCFMASSLGELFSWKKPFNRRAVYPPLLLSTDRYPLEVQGRSTLADMQASTFPRSGLAHSKVEEPNLRAVAHMSAPQPPTVGWDAHCFPDQLLSMP